MIILIPLLKMTSNLAASSSSHNQEFPNLNGDLTILKMSEKSHMTTQRDESECSQHVYEGNRNSVLKTETHHDIPSGKDGGYGWVVVFAVLFINMMCAGFIKTFGLLVIVIREYFPDASSASIGAIISLQNGCMGLLAPLMGALTVTIGARTCVTSGAILVCVGLLLSIFATDVVFLAFTIGAMAGTGVCISGTSGVIEVNKYWENRRATANGISTAGNPLGGMLFPLIYAALLETYGLPGAYIPIAGIMLQIAVMAFLLRPFELHKKYVIQKYIKTLDISSGDMKKLTKSYAVTSQLNLKKKKPLDFRLLKNPLYLTFVSMNVGITFVLPNRLYYYALYANTIGLSSWEISTILAYYSGMDFCCRLICGWLTDQKIYKKSHAFIAGLLVSGIGLFLVPFTWNMWTLMAVMGINALGHAYYYVHVAVLLADMFGEDTLATTWGFFRMSQGIGFFISPPLIGLLADTSGGLTLCFYLMAAMMCWPAAIFALMPCVACLAQIPFVFT